MIYSARIVELRENRGLKQYEVANLLNIYKGVYNEYEKEYVIIPIKHLVSLCYYFKVSLDYIFELTDIPNYIDCKQNIDKVLSGDRLKLFRKENKLTQDKLAKILNISRTTIAEYERGTNLIATPFLYTICKKYNISADYLLGRTDEPKYLK